MSDEAQPSDVGESPRLWPKALRIVAFAAIVGPPIGAAFAATLALSHDFLMSRPTVEARDLPSFVFYSLGAGYLFGLAPAALAGAIYAIADAVAPRRAPRWLIATGIGGATTLAYWVVVFRGPPGENVASLGFFVAIGAAAAFACVLIAGRNDAPTQPPAAPDQSAAPPAREES